MEIKDKLAIGLKMKNRMSQKRLKGAGTDRLSKQMSASITSRYQNSARYVLITSPSSLEETKKLKSPMNLKELRKPRTYLWTPRLQRSLRSARSQPAGSQSHQLRGKRKIL